MGDWDLGAQPLVLDLLQAPKRLGLTLTAGGMLVPEKSVTALVGISDRKEEACGQSACAAPNPTAPSGQGQRRFSATPNVSVPTPGAGPQRGPLPLLIFD